MNCTDILTLEPIKDQPCGKQVNVVRTITIYPSWYSPIDKIRGLEESVVLKHRREVADNPVGKASIFLENS